MPCLSMHPVGWSCSNSLPSTKLTQRHHTRTGKTSSASPFELAAGGSSLVAQDDCCQRDARDQDTYD